MAFDITVTFLVPDRSSTPAILTHVRTVIWREHNVHISNRSLAPSTQKCSHLGHCRSALIIILQRCIIEEKKHWPFLWILNIAKSYLWTLERDSINVCSVQFIPSSLNGLWNTKLRNRESVEIWRLASWCKYSYCLICDLQCSEAAIVCFTYSSRGRVRDRAIGRRADL